MIRHILFFISFLMFTPTISQVTKKIETGIPGGKFLEVFEVDSDTASVKNGNYKKFRNKKLIEKGTYIENVRNGSWETYSMKGPLIAKGEYKSDEKVGIWKYFSASGKTIQEYDHDHDSLIYFNIQEEKKFGNAPTVFPDTAKDQFPIFIGGTSYMKVLIENNMMYPKKAFEEGKTATVFISFVVQKDGTTTEVKSLRHIGDGFDEEAIRLVSYFGKSWIPASQNEKRVRVQYNIPLHFKLQ